MRWGWRARVVAELVRAAAPMLRIELSLRRGASLPATCRRLGIRLDLDSAAPPAVGPVRFARQERAAVRAGLLMVSRWPGGDTCLRQCLLIGHRLRARRPVLRIGVRRDPRGEFAAHSWLEFDGCAMDPQAADYATLGAPR